MDSNIILGFLDVTWFRFILLTLKNSGYSFINEFKLGLIHYPKNYHNIYYH